MKKTVTIMLLAMLALALVFTGCAKKEEPAKPTTLTLAQGKPEIDAEIGRASCRESV